MEVLGIPQSVRQLIWQRQGLILVTGPTGSGKSTTLAAMIDYINQTRPCHVVTSNQLARSAAPGWSRRTTGRTCATPVNCEVALGRCRRRQR